MKCRTCENQTRSGSDRCDTCLKTHAQKAKERRQWRTKSSLCPTCGDKAEVGQICSRCRQSRLAHYNPTKKKAAHVNRRKDLVQETFAAYGGPKCSCCGEDNPLFLTIDHTDGGGNQHREEVGSGVIFYAWLKKHGFPKGYRVMCFNCNCGRARNGGICPHMDVIRG